MRKLIWGRSFIRAFKRICKKHPGLSKDIEETLKLLTENPFHRKLETHKLKGKLAGSWACRIGYDMRLIFEFVKDEKETEDKILLLELGTHDEVY